MGVDVADFDNSGAAGIAVTNFDNEMIALYRPGAGGSYTDIAIPSGVGPQSRSTLGFGCVFFDADLDGNLDLLAVNGHIDETVRNITGDVGYAQAPLLFLNDGHSRFRDIAGHAGTGFASPKGAPGVACTDFDPAADVARLYT